MFRGHPDSERLRAMRPALEMRDRILRATRRFFQDHGFLEVTTPVRVAAPALEEHIDAEPSGEFFLRTSPELQMKRLLAAGFPRLFQVGPCFRKDERGPLHNPEYTMLEWYRAHADYSAILVDAKALVMFLAAEVLGSTDIVYQGTRIALAPVWERLTVSEAFIRFAGWDPARHFDADRFDLDLVEKVEPQLPRDVPVVLTDYPAARAALARRKPDDPTVAERWELYVGGMEIANAFSELADPREQAARFEECARARKAAGRAVYPVDQEFLAALESGMPPSGGIALGVDRLVMLLADKASVADVLPFT